MEMIGAAFRRPFVIEPMSDVFSDLILPVRAGLPENYPSLIEPIVLP